MAKNKFMVTELPEFTSLRDMSNQFALDDDRSIRFARHAAQFAMDNGIGSDTAKLSEEHKGELYEGFKIRYHSNNAIKRYSKEGDDTFIPHEGADAKEGVVELGVDVAMSYTTHAFGQLKSTRPNYHALVKAWRDGFSTYASQKLGRLMGVIKGIENENAGITKTRAPNAEFIVWTNKTLDGIKTRNKNARSKGDTTALSDVQINKAVDAFKAALL